MDSPTPASPEQIPPSNPVAPVAQAATPVSAPAPVATAPAAPAANVSHVGRNIAIGIAVFVVAAGAVLYFVVLPKIKNQTFLYLFSCCFQSSVYFYFIFLSPHYIYRKIGYLLFF